MIYIVPDTNQLYICYEKTTQADVYRHFSVGNKINKLLDIRDSANCIDEVAIVIPEIVIRELIQQKYEHFNEDYCVLLTLAQKMGENINPELVSREEYCNTSYDQAQEYFGILNVGIVPMCTSTSFPHIIDNAIKKEPPFEGKNGKADKGFKDALLLYSLIEYASNHKGDYIIVSEDRVLSDKISQKKLRNTFAFHSGCRLNIFSNIEEIRARIETQRSSIHLESIAYSFAEIKKILNEGTPRIPVNLYQNKIIFIGNEPIVHILNNLIDALFDSDLCYWEQWDTPKYSDEPDMVYESILDVSVKNNTCGILSFVIIDYVYVGGVHGDTAEYAYTFDINNGRQLSLSQLLQKDNSELCEQISACVNDDISSSEEGKYFDESVCIRDADNIVFYIQNNQVHIVFNEYELGPYASGAIDLVLCDLPEKYQEKDQGGKM